MNEGALRPVTVDGARGLVPEPAPARGRRAARDHLLPHVRGGARRARRRRCPSAWRPPPRTSPTRPSAAGTARAGAASSPTSWCCRAPGARATQGRLRGRCRGRSTPPTSRSRRRRPTQPIVVERFELHRGFGRRRARSAAAAASGATCASSPTRASSPTCPSASASRPTASSAASRAGWPAPSSIPGPRRAGRPRQAVARVRLRRRRSRSSSPAPAATAIRSQRDPARVLDDVLDDYVSVEAARRDVRRRDRGRGRRSARRRARATAALRAERPARP